MAIATRDQPKVDARPGPRPRRARVDAGQSTGRRLILGLVGMLILVAILEIVSRLGIVNEKFLPPFSSVVVAMVGLFGDPVFLVDVWSTIASWFFGITLSICIAVPLGVALGLSNVGYRASRSLIELIRPMPPVALIPLVILVLGQGLEMKLVIAVYAAIWPILFNTIYGVHGTDPKAKEMGKSFGLSPFAVTRRIVVPSAGPMIATGVRISSSIVLIVIITVELIAGGTTGLGAFIGRMRGLGDQVELVYAGILVAGLLGLAVNLLLGWLERRYFSWSRTRGGA